LRRELASRRRGVPAAEAERAGLAVAERVAELPGFSRCARLALYASVGAELQVDALRRLAEARGLPLFWPRVAGARLDLVEARAAELEPGAFGVREPPGGRPPAELATGDWLVIPGLAFDARGRRLGRGGGFYDRLLARLREPMRVGVGYDFQCVDEVPAGPLDRCVDWVVTERRVLDARRRDEGDS
jgi:5-formyltetrahydrofolate cyclo-ligase